MKTHPAWLLPAEMHEDATEVLRVLLDPHVLSSWRVLLEEAKHVLLELARPLARDDLDQRRLLRLGLIEDAVQCLLDVRAPVVDVVQIERQLHLPRLCRTGQPRNGHHDAASGSPYGQTVAMTFAAVSPGSPSESTVSIPSSGAGGSKAAS